MIMLVVLAALPLIAYGSSCELPPLSIQVFGSSRKPDISERFTLVALNKMAEQSGHPRNHPVLGFFTGQLAYAAELSVSNSNSQSVTCPEKIELRIHMQFKEHIEVANDSPGRICREFAVEHYGKHAEAEEAEFTRMTQEINSTFGRKYMASPPHPAGLSPDQYRTAALNLVRRLLSSSFENFDARRRAIREAVDHQDTVGALETVCPGSG